MIPPKGFKPVPLYSIEHNYTHRKEAKKGWFYWSPSDPIRIKQVVFLSPYARKITFKKVKT